MSQVASHSKLRLPIDQLKDQFFHHFRHSPLVISAPTGSGKSTQIPRWCYEYELREAQKAARHPRPVLVIEPRRIACQSLAQRVAFLESVTLGQEVGYIVRDDNHTHSETMIIFVTTGVALRLWRVDQFNDYSAVVIDEFHERSLDLDLLLALCHRRENRSLVVMSATFAASRVTEHLKGIHLSGEERRHEVDVSYRPHGNGLPHIENLIEALPFIIDEACDEAIKNSLDVLVFLPGKSEIYEAQTLIERRWRETQRTLDRETIPLHGGLSLKEQSKVFQESGKQRVILSTNVAETSLTVPKVGIVVDSGLVRRTRYDRGRGALALTEIANDSAEQRRGRAGRLSSGQCWRLWSKGVQLKAFTPPEIFRESLAPLYLAASACGAKLGELPFLDPPKESALSDAQSMLSALGAISSHGGLTDSGEALFDLGINLHHGRWLIEALKSNDPILIHHFLSLVSILSLSKPLFFPGKPNDPSRDLREEGCDAQAFIYAMDLPIEEAEHYHINPQSLREAKEHYTKLSKAIHVDIESQVKRGSINRQQLALTLIRADPNHIYLMRERRRQREAWVGGGPEMSLGRESALALLSDSKSRARIEALFVLASHVTAKSGRMAEHKITASIPLSLEWIKRSGLGEERLGEVSLKQGKLTVELERVFRKRILERRSLEPKGEFARQALVTCLLRDQPWPVVSEIKDRLERLRLTEELIKINEYPTHLSHLSPPCIASSTTVESWLQRRLIELGFEEATDLELLSRDDVLPPILHEEILAYLNKVFPQTLNLNDARYTFHYDVEKRRVIMEQVSGSRKEAPRAEWLPHCGGFEVRFKNGQHDSALRARRHLRH